MYRYSPWAERQSGHHICIFALTFHSRSRVSGQSDLTVCATPAVIAGRWGFNQETGCDPSAASQRHVRWSSRIEPRADCLVTTAGFITPATRVPALTLQPDCLDRLPLFQSSSVMSPMPMNRRARPRCKQNQPTLREPRARSRDHHLDMQMTTSTMGRYLDFGC